MPPWVRRRGGPLCDTYSVPVIILYYQAGKRLYTSSVDNRLLFTWGGQLTHHHRADGDNGKKDHHHDGRRDDERCYDGRAEDLLAVCHLMIPSYHIHRGIA